MIIKIILCLLCVACAMSIFCVTSQRCSPWTRVCVTSQHCPSELNMQLCAANGTIPKYFLLIVRAFKFQYPIVSTDVDICTSKSLSIDH